MDRMDSVQIFSLIEAIAAQPKKTEKIALLSGHSGDESLRRVLDLALNPFARFGVRELPVRRLEGQNMLGDRHWALASQLLERQLTGHAARDAIQSALDDLNADSAALFSRILGKDLRAGIGDALVNSAFPGLIPEFAYMRCSLPKHVKLKTWPWERGIYSQLKADGMFANVSVELSGDVSVTSRQGHELPAALLGTLVSEMATRLRRGYQYHGELLVQRQELAGWITLPREESNGALKLETLPPGHRVIFLAWDMIPLDVVKPKGSYSVPYADRFAELQALVGAPAEDDSAQIGLIPTRIVHSMEAAFAHYKEQLALGLEGTILKRPDAIWRDGDSTEQVKLKLKVQVELRVIGFNEGTGKNRGSLGSFQTASECGEVETNVNGRSTAMRKEVWSDLDSWRDAIICVDTNGLLAPKKSGGKHSLFLPIFVERRDDKRAADTLARIEDLIESAINA